MSIKGAEYGQIRAKVILIALVLVVTVAVAYNAFSGTASEERSGVGDLWVMNVDGSDLQRLTDSCQATAPLWLPDSRRLEYIIRDLTDIGADKLTVLDVDSPGNEPFVVPGTTAFAHANWSPDGNRIAYKRERAIYVLEIGGGPPTRIAEVPSGWWADLAWSPDGARLAYINSYWLMNGESEANAWITKADGSERILAASDRGTSPKPHWSPDGTLLVLQNFALSGNTVVVSADGSGREVVWPKLDVDRLFWSPDGQHIAVTECLSSFSCFKRQDEEAIYVVEPDGGNRRTVSRGEIQLLGWAADGAGIIYRANQTGNDLLYQIDPQGSQPALLATIPLGGINPILAPNGRRIAFRVTTCGPDVNEEQVEQDAARAERAATIQSAVDFFFDTLCVPLLFLQTAGNVVAIVWKFGDSSPRRRRFNWLLALSVAFSILAWLFVLYAYLLALAYGVIGGV